MSQPTSFIARSPVNNKYEKIPTTFNNNIIKQEDVYMPMHIFGTGSSGNSVWLKDLNLLVDLGLRKKIHSFSIDSNTLSSRTTTATT